MADYFDGSESAKAKIVSAVWDVHEVNGELFGVIRTGLREILFPGRRTGMDRRADWTGSRRLRRGAGATPYLYC